MPTNETCPAPSTSLTRNATGPLLVLAWHSKVSPACCSTGDGQETVADRWRFVRIATAMAWRLPDPRWEPLMPPIARGFE